LDRVGEGVAVTTADGTLIYCSAGLERVFDRPSSSLVGAKIFDLVAREQRKALCSLHEHVIDTDATRHTELLADDGRALGHVALRRVDLASTGHGGSLAPGQTPAGAVWSFALPTEDPLVRFQLAVRGTEFGFWDLDLVSSEIIWWNDWCAGVDLDPCAGAGHAERWDANVHPEDRPRLQSFEDLVAGRCALYDAEYRIRTRSGAWLWVLSRGRVTLRDEQGCTLRVTGITIDIDARKRTELALSESEARLEAAVWGTDIGVWEGDGSGSFRWCNDWCSPRGIDPHEGRGAMQQWFTQIHPEDLAHYQQCRLNTHSGASDLYVVEYRIRTRAQRWRWLHERGRVITRDARGHTTRVVGVCLDIDARKRMEIALRVSEARLETAIWGSDLGLWDWNLQSDAMVWLSDWPMRYAIDVSAISVTRAEWLERIHPADRGRYLKDDVALHQRGVDASEGDYRIRDTQGGWHWVNVRTRVIERDATGRALRVVGACIDVNARRCAEQLLRTQALILETMREGVLLLDAAGRIEFTNPAFERMVGREAGELTGTAVIDLFNLRERRSSKPLSLDRLLRRFEARKQQRQVSFRRRDGSQFAGEVLLARIEQNGARKSLIVIQDVSERNRLEQEIAEASSRERRRLGSDLHDGLGQELTGIALLLRSFANQIGATDEAVLGQLNGIIGLVNHAVETARTMALGLSPATPARDDFVAALRSLAAWSRTNFGIQVRVRVAAPPNLQIEEANATHLYLIAQEAILNAVKHGRAQLIDLSLRAGEQLVSLTITDDGIGLPPEPTASAGLGMKIMAYRAGMIGGSVHIKSRKQGGTRVRCFYAQTPRKPKARKFSRGRTPVATS
jgi:PAS domain S-box-containing protein